MLLRTWARSSGLELFGGGLGAAQAAFGQQADGGDVGEGLADAQVGGAERARFPTPEPLICAAGVAPSTRQSGKHKAVTFRWPADKQLRDAVCDFAGDSRRASPWAAQLYDNATGRGKTHPHAVRILACAWLYVI